MRRPILRRGRLDAYAVACAVAAVVLAAVVFLNDLGHFNTDIKPEVYLAPWEMVGRYLSSWTASPYLGSANFNVGLVPVLLVLSALRGIGLSPEWTFKVFHLALWLVAAWGAARLTRTVAPRSTRWLGLAAAVFYLANPYAIAAGNTLAIALPMAFLPWLLLCYLRALQRPSSWAWPALFGLAFFAMSGMNVAVVPLFQLFGIIPIAAVARWHLHRTWREVAAVTAKCALFVIAVSLYWLVPAMSAVATGSQIVGTSETIDGIHKVSSFTEVLRGLGLWPLYGHGDAGPWVPQNAAYITSPWVIALTALWPALALVSLRWARTGVRRAAALTAAIAAVVMVGLFPGENDAESPAGWLIQAVLAFPPLAAFRTTNKIGALLALSFALALAFGAVHLTRLVRRRSGLAPIAAALASIVVAAWMLPALANGLYISRMDIPSYWDDAARAADDGAPHSSTLVLPGQTRPTYRWTVQRPDDLTNSLLKRDAVIPETTPNASAPGGNFLAALDDTVQSGTASGDMVSTFARYLGSDNVLVRHDTVWENDGGARPAVVQALIGTDTGLFGSGNFGKPGQNVLSPVASPAGYDEASLRPVQLYTVRDPRTAVRAQSMANSLVVAGDGWSFPEMVNAGLLRTSPSVQYAQDLDAAALTRALQAKGRLVITDTNARRSAIAQRLTAGNGALLAAGDPLGTTRTLGDSPDDQTVLLRSGTLVTATTSGGTFFDLPYAVPENAFDGNPDTSWRFGDFRRAVGQRLDLTLPARQTLGVVTIAQPDLGPVKIDKATMTAGGRSVTVRVPDSGKATFHMGGVSADRVSVHIDSIRGDGFNLVGISELGLPGPKATRAARTPTTLTRLYTGLDDAGRSAFSSAPLDVLLRRVENTPAAADDSEIALRRVVSLPQGRTFTADARVRIDGDDLEKIYDEVAGYSDAVRATSSGVWFDKRQYRASAAADGKSDTGWVPGGASPKGAWWQLTTAPRDITSVDLTQKPTLGDAKRTQWATKVSVLVDGKKVASSSVNKNGDTHIALPDGTRGSRVRVVIDASDGPELATPAEFTRIDTGASMKTSDLGPFDSPGKNRCLDVATIDGRAVPMRLDDDTITRSSQEGTRWVSCTPVTLDAGDRRIEQAPGFVLDSLDLRDNRKQATSVPAAPAFRVTDDTPTHKTIRLESSATPSAVVIGQSYDARWSATLNGKALPAPTTIDGYSTGWILPAGAQGTVEMRFAPQRWANVALIVTLLTLAAIAAIVIVAARGGGLRAPVPHRSERYARSMRRADAVARRSDAQCLRLDVVCVVVATFGVGAAGLVASLVAVAVLRLTRVRSRHLVVAGALLVLAGVGAFLLLDPSLGQVSADAIAANMWPHRIAGAGFVIALIGLLRQHDAPRTARRSGGSHRAGPHTEAATDPATKTATTDRAIAERG